MIKLELLRGSKVIRAYKIKSDTFTIGAEAGCTIRAAGDATVLPKHATAYVEEGELVLVPEPGAEVLLNGEPVDFAVPGPDDVLKIGRLTFRVELVEAVDSIAPPPPGRASVPPRRASVPPVRPSAPPPRRSVPPPAFAPRPELSPKPLAKADEPAPLPTPPAEEPDTVPVPIAQPAPEPRPEPEPEPEPVPEPAPEEPIDFGAEPDEEFYFSDFDDDEEGFVEPFDLAEELLKPGERARGGRREPYCAAHVVRVVGGRVVEAFGVLPGKPFRARNGEVSCRIKGGRLVLTADQGLAGEIQQGEQTLDLAGVAVGRRGSRSAVLGDGDLAVVRGDGATEYKVEAYRPPAFLRRGGARLGKGFFVMIGVAFALHVVVGVAVAYVQPTVTDEGQAKEEEVFAEVKIDKPADTATPQEIELEEAPKDATQMAEKAPAVSARQVRKIKDNKEAASSTVSSLLNILNKGSGKPGASNDLKDLVSNIDAVSGPGSNPAFNIAGAIASLPGEGVNIAKQGGGGYLSTLSGEDVAGKGSDVAKLDKKTKPGKVRGKVTKMSSGAKVSGKLAMADVARVVNSHIGQITACYEHALLSNPALGGRIVFDWTVTTSGGVSNVRVRSSTLGDAGVASCISGKIKRWKFPKPEGGNVTITYPFLFRSVSS